MKTPICPWYIMCRPGFKPVFSYPAFPTTDEIIRNTNFARCCNWMSEQQAAMTPKEREKPLTTKLAKEYPEWMNVRCNNRQLIPF